MPISHLFDFHSPVDIHSSSSVHRPFYHKYRIDWHPSYLHKTHLVLDHTILHGPMNPASSTPDRVVAMYLVHCLSGLRTHRYRHLRHHGWYTSVPHRCPKLTWAGQSARPLLHPFVSDHRITSTTHY